jgi:hypothetical protein
MHSKERAKERARGEPASGHTSGCSGHVFET